MPRLLPFVLVSCVAACGGSSGATPIAGGKPVQFQGVTFDVPAAWSTQSADDGMRLEPAGANASGTLEELYLLMGDRSVRSLDGPAVEAAVVRVVQQLHPDAERRDGPLAATFGALPGRRWTWHGRPQFDQDVEIRVFAWLGDHAGALFAVGLPAALARRAAEVDAILGSLAKAASAPAGEPAGAGGVAAELVGQWLWLGTVTANQGGSQSNTWITLQQDGRYQWHHDSVSTNPNGAAWGASDETGSWSYAGSTITFRPDGGAPYTQALEKRNHPQNHNDPMLVLDGKAYVTATARRPW
jgi:hypothetical protein